jgi:ABC-type proline/glycine betaine transport system permease subunit
VNPRAGVQALLTRLPARRRALVLITLGVVAVDSTGIVVVLVMTFAVVPLPPVWEDPTLQEQTLTLACANTFFSGAVAVFLAYRVVAA